MLYEFDLVIPANTSASAPAEFEAIIAAGAITQIEVQIPLGCRSLVHTVALVGIHQQWPSNPDATIKGDGARIIWGESYALNESPFLIKLMGWSPTTVFQHIITWRFIVTPTPENVSEDSGVIAAVKRLLSPLGVR